MHAKFERLLSKSLTTLEVMTYYLVVHTAPAWFPCDLHHWIWSTRSIVYTRKNKKKNKKTLNSIVHLDRNNSCNSVIAKKPKSKSQPFVNLSRSTHITHTISILHKLQTFMTVYNTDKHEKYNTHTPSLPLP